MDENIVVLRGRLVEDPSLKERVATIRLATNQKWVDSRGDPQEKATFLNVVLFEKNMTIAQAYLRKGSQVRLKAHLQNSKWVDPNGETKYRLDIVADEIALIPTVEADAEKKYPAYDSTEIKANHVQREQEPDLDQTLRPAMPRRGMPVRRPMQVARPQPQQAQPQQAQPQQAQPQQAQPQPQPRQVVRSKEPPLGVRF